MSSLPPPNTNDIAGSQPATASTNISETLNNDLLPTDPSQRDEIVNLRTQLNGKTLILEGGPVCAGTAEGREISHRKRLLEQLKLAQELRAVLEDAADRANDARALMIELAPQMNQLVALTEAVQGGYTLDSYDCYNVQAQNRKLQREQDMELARDIIQQQRNELANSKLVDPAVVAAAAARKMNKHQPEEEILPEEPKPPLKRKFPADDKRESKKRAPKRNKKSNHQHHDHPPPNHNFNNKKRRTTTSTSHQTKPQQEEQRPQEEDEEGEERPADDRQETTTTSKKKQQGRPPPRGNFEEAQEQAATPTRSRNQQQHYDRKGKEGKGGREKNNNVGDTPPAGSLLVKASSSSSSDRRPALVSRKQIQQQYNAAPPAGRGAPEEEEEPGNKNKEQQQSAVTAGGGATTSAATSTTTTSRRYQRKTTTNNDCDEDTNFHDDAPPLDGPAAAGDHHGKNGDHDGSSRPSNKRTTPPTERTQARTSWGGDESFLGGRKNKHDEDVLASRTRTENVVTTAKPRPVMNKRKKGSPTKRASDNMPSLRYVPTAAEASLASIKQPAGDTRKKGASGGAAALSPTHMSPSTNDIDSSDDVVLEVEYPPLNRARVRAKEQEQQLPQFIGAAPRKFSQESPTPSQGGAEQDHQEEADMEATGIPSKKKPPPPVEVVPDEVTSQGSPFSQASLFQAAPMLEKKCHHCKKKSRYHRKCNYWNATGSMCGKHFCQDCLDTVYSSTTTEDSRLGNARQQGNDPGGLEDNKTKSNQLGKRSWHCPACLGTCVCPRCIAKREKAQKAESLRTAAIRTRRGTRSTRSSANHVS